MVTSAKQLGKRIRQLRKELNYTLRQIEERSGVSYSQLSKIERGESVPLKSNLDKISDALGGEVKNELYYLAGYLPESEYIEKLKGGYQLRLPELSQDIISEDVYGKIKQHRAEAGKETEYVSFDEDNVIVYETTYHGDSLHEKEVSYKVSDVLQDIFEEQLVSLKMQPRSATVISSFSDWVKTYLSEFDLDTQERITEEVKGFIKFKVYEIKNSDD